MRSHPTAPTLCPGGTPDPPHPNPADQRWDPEPHLQPEWGHQPVSAGGGAGPGGGHAWAEGGHMDQGLPPGRARVEAPESFPLPRKPNTLKQKNGFPPNFIHSLDSSHMMLTALHCYRWAGRTPPSSVHHLLRAGPVQGVGDAQGTQRVAKAGWEARSDRVRGLGQRLTAGEDPSHVGCWSCCPEKDYASM